MNIKGKKIHFIGIGGIGMSAMARMCASKGAFVSGSDRSQSEITDALLGEGMKITIGSDAKNISDDVSLVVYTIAIPEDDEEIVEAKNKNILLKTYPQMLGIMTMGHKTIAISGTHGKTTTTAMTIKVLGDASKEPFGIVGSLMKMKDKTGQEKYTNYIDGNSEYFVIEACEYKRSFLNVKPYILVVTNIDNDHLDYYKDIADIQSAFTELASYLTEEGALVCDIDDPLLAPVISATKARVIDYKKFIPNFEMKVPGDHNRKDAGCALAVADFVGIDKEVSKKSIAQFAGTWRRFEFLGQSKDGALIYDDYGHHPTEIMATLKGAREKFPNKKIIVAFHPHLFSRTKILFEDFSHAFSDADFVVLAPIFPAREPFDPSISSEMLSEAINTNGKEAVAVKSLDEVEGVLRTKMDKDSVIITMGAGDIYKVSTKLI